MHSGPVSIRHFSFSSSRWNLCSNRCTIGVSVSIAYYLKEDLRQIWSQPDKRTARRVLRDWLARARASKIRILVQFAATLEEHQEGVLNYYNYPISTGPL